MHYGLAGCEETIGRLGSPKVSVGREEKKRRKEENNNKIKKKEGREERNERACVG